MVEVDGLVAGLNGRTLALARTLPRAFRRARNAKVSHPSTPSSPWASTTTPSATSSPGTLALSLSSFSARILLAIRFDTAQQNSPERQFAQTPSSKLVRDVSTSNSNCGPRLPTSNRAWSPIGRDSAPTMAALRPNSMSSYLIRVADGFRERTDQVDCRWSTPRIICGITAPMNCLHRRCFFLSRFWGARRVGTRSSNSCSPAAVSKRTFRWRNGSLAMRSRSPISTSRVLYSRHFSGGPACRSISVNSR